MDRRSQEVFSSREESAQRNPAIPRRTSSRLAPQHESRSLPAPSPLPSRRLLERFQRHPLRRMARIKVGQPFLAVLLLLLLAASGSTAQSQESAPPIRVTVNRVNVGVTVTDSTGHFISGLRRQDFHLFDN